MKENFNKIQMIPLGLLTPHEFVTKNRVEAIMKILEKGIYCFPPIVIDQKTKVIIDGHHRFEALKNINCDLCPCVEIDYLSNDFLALEKGSSGKKLDKKKIIADALSGKLYEPKYTYHTFKNPRLEYQHISKRNKSASIHINSLTAEPEDL